MVDKAPRSPSVDTESVTDTMCSYTKYPEGGKDAWLTVVGSFLVYYSSFGIINSFGFFQDYYQTEYLTKVSPSTISIIGTLQLALMNFLSTVAGGICDAHGIRYLYLFSGLGTSLAFMTLSFCSHNAVWGILLTQGLFMGVTMGFGVQPACTVVAHHFNERRAISMGIVCAGSSLGGVCFSLMFGWLQPLIGFPWTMRVAAIKVLACYSIALWISTAKPSGGPLKLRNLFDFRNLSDARFTVLALGGCLANFGLWLPGFHIKTYASKVYPSYSIGPYLLPLMSGSSIPGSVIGGLLGDHFGRLNVLFPMTFLSGFICLSIWLLEPTISVLALFASLFGFASGAVVSLLPSTICQTLPPDKIGARMGAFYSFISISTLTGAPIGAAIIGKAPVGKEDYRGLIAFAGTTMLIGALVLFAARIIHSRDLRTKW